MKQVVDQSTIRPLHDEERVTDTRQPVFGIFLPMGHDIGTLFDSCFDLPPLGVQQASATFVPKADNLQWDPLCFQIDGRFVRALAMAGSNENNVRLLVNRSNSCMTCA